ncbi:MAG: hypothetical protein VXY83_03955 [Pseudomonadota bacterium]|nr:hypothetical protein [Magnetococcales bacterium]MAF32219.1 hypothetical protein [Magnetococcales bacterium]MEC8467492.1 hypothetical protein [Pseudomonadota bacterium]|tara:strand:- start:6362 stop:6598 length:237 start_codon:yes stop_codon:yes gene_type:complete
MARKKNKRRSAKALERRKQKRIQEAVSGNTPHRNMAYVDPEMMKQAGVHGERDKNKKSNRRKDKLKLKNDINKGSYTP